MAALLVLMSVAAIAMTAALPVWKTMAQREKEEELIFRGNQYAHAIALFQRKYGGAFPPDLDVLVREKFLRRKYKDPITGGDFQIVGPGDAAAANLQPPAAGAATPGGRATTPTGATQQGLGQPAQQTGGIARGTAQGGAFNQPPRPVGSPGGIGPSAGVMGVASKSTAKAFRVYNGRDKYNEWIFVATQASQRAGGPPGTQTPGGRGANLPGGGRGAGAPFGAGRGFGTGPSPAPGRGFGTGGP